ncbi:uncharacterized protein LOC124161539 [Ischnura elegans]|uniref:uncharacterized protein LOC124161539 n=1 Tax=Ischnura elegans TaxID=197161 RepID=UPI001ED89139|nr:uncharacterized protein LOC124161539 [Ischnura elegans]
MVYKTVKIDSIFKPKSLNGIKVYSLNESKTLILWYKRCAWICPMTYPVERVTRCYGVLHCINDIRDVIVTKSTLLCLSHRGMIYAADLQEAISRKTAQAIDHKELSFVKNVITINATSNGFLLITENGELMAFSITRLENGKSKLSLRMIRKIPGCTVNNSPCITVFNPQDIHTSLTSLLFKDIALLKCDIVFIGLYNGDVYWLPLVENEGDSKFNLLHHSPSPIANIALASDGKVDKINLILILSSNGSLAVVDQMEKQLKFRVHYLPGSIACSSMAGPCDMFHSDGLNLWRSEISSGPEGSVNIRTQLLHIKGAVDLAYDSRSLETIVGCRHCILYKIEPSSPVTSDGSDVLASTSETITEIESLMHEWHNTTEELNLMKEKIAAENKLLQEISTAVRGTLLRDMIKLKAEVSDDFPFALKNNVALKVLNESPQEFSNEFWLFHIQVNSGEWNFSVTEHLESSFKPNNTMIFIVPITTANLKYPVTVDCSLVLSVPMGDSSKDSGRQLHEVPLQRISLDITDFLSPIFEDQTVSHQSLLQDEVPWDEFLSRFKHVSSVQDVNVRKGESQLLHCYSFKLPENESWTEFRDRLWKKPDLVLREDLKNATKLKFRVRNNIITFSCSGDSQTITIMTSNKDILSEIQGFVVYKTLSKPKDSARTSKICIDEIKYLKFRNINLALELEIEKGASWKNLNALKQELRSLFELQLPEWEKS